MAKKDLRPGYVDKLDLPSELLEALDNRGQMTVQHVNNEYGETLIGYRAVRGYHDNMKGEFVIIVEGTNEVVYYSNLDIVEHVKLYLDDLSEMDAIKRVAKERGVSKSEIYKKYHDSK